MGKKHPSSQERVWFASRQFLEPFKQCCIDTACPKLNDQLIVVDRKLLPIRRNGALDVPRCDDLIVCQRRVNRLGGCGSTGNAGGAIGLSEEGD